MQNNDILLSFMAFLGLFVLIGLLSVVKRKKSADDYLLAGRSISPAFVGLSGAASTASGFGFTGIIGFGYVMGLSGAWFIFGIIFGSLIAFAITARRFRTYTQRRKHVSYTEFLASDNAGFVAPRLRLVLGILSVAAVILYATAQLTAGSKALHVLFGWDYKTGAIMGAMIVLLYCWAGGIRASIWTDVAQIIVMYGAMTVLMIVSLDAIGGLEALYESLKAIDPALVTLFPETNMFGPLLFILGCLSVGISFIGFPHVMVRFMTLRTSKEVKRAIGWYELSYGAFYITAYIVALCTRVLIEDSSQFDTELALPLLALDMLPAVLVGVILAGIFAGTISTADSLVLSGTSSLARDIATKFRDSYIFMKLATIAVTGAALGLALTGNQSVFDLVMFVIALMGAGFAPLLFVRAMRWQVGEILALCMIAGGIAAAVSWRMAGFHGQIFDSFPGMICALMIYAAGRILAQTKAKLANRG